MCRGLLTESPDIQSGQCGPARYRASMQPGVVQFLDPTIRDEGSLRCSLDRSSSMLGASPLFIRLIEDQCCRHRSCGDDAPTGRQFAHHTPPKSSLFESEDAMANESYKFIIKSCFVPRLVL